MAAERLENLPEPVRDALATAIGLGVLGFQQLQVRRRDFEKTTGVSIPPSPAELADMIRRFTERA
jgi:hypothetical protein